VLHDLYEEKFDPNLPVEEISEKAQLSDNLNIPLHGNFSGTGYYCCSSNWWGQPPAILKGWWIEYSDRDLHTDLKKTIAAEGVPVGLLKASTAVIFNTSNTQPERELRIFGDHWRLSGRIVSLIFVV